MPEIWETVDLLEVTYPDQDAPPDDWWLRTLFPRVFQSQAQEIIFDDLPVRDRRLAPYVAPNVQGRIMRTLGGNVKSFAPAYVKPKARIDPAKAIIATSAEQIRNLARQGGELSLDARYDAAVARALLEQRGMIERRWDYMACEAVRDGAIIIEGEDYPRVEISFGRHASLTATLAGAAQWDEATSAPLADIGDMRKNAMLHGRASVGNLVFGEDAWSAFEQHESTLKLLDNMRRGSNSEFNTTGLSDGSPVEYVGQVSGPNNTGRLDLWKYSNEYVQEDENGVQTVVPYIHPGDVIGFGRAVGGVQAFGAIMDKKARLQAMPIFPKMWDDDDPDATWVMSQSAPLMVPTNVNNTFRLRVV